MAKIIADALDIDCKDTGCAVVTGVLGASLASLGVGALSMQRARGSSTSGGGGADILVTGVTLVAGSIAIVGTCSLVFSACRKVREGLEALCFQSLYATYPTRIGAHVSVVCTYRRRRRWPKATAAGLSLQLPLHHRRAPPIFPKRNHHYSSQPPPPDNGAPAAHGRPRGDDGG